MMICGKDYPVIGQVETPSGASVPLVDVPMMDDEKWRREAVKNAVDNYIKEFGKEPETEEEAAQWQRRECEEAQGRAHQDWRRRADHRVKEGKNGENMQ